MIITLISGLIFTSLIKNKTRLLEKELVNLDNEINSINSNLREATLDFQYLTTPKHISFLAVNFLDEYFSYYKKSQIKKSTKPEKDLTISKKIKNTNTFNELDTSKLFNKNKNTTKVFNNKKLFITSGIDKEQSKISKKKVVSKKAKNWVGFQIVKAFLGIPTIPVK